MQNMFRFIGPLVLGLVLAGCGGGGGSGGGAGASGGSGGISNPDGAWLTFTPESIVVPADEGASTRFLIKATSSRTIDTVVNAAVLDPNGMITTETTLTAASATEYQAMLRTSPLLRAGDHQTTLEVRLCRDDPLVCRDPVPGSPWRLRLKVVVKSVTNLTALVPVPGLGPWSTNQGNAAHTGFVPASFDVKNFNRRWTISARFNEPLSRALLFGKPAIDNGMLFVTSARGPDGNDVVAISEESGTEVWRAHPGGFFGALPPAAANGRVYFTSESADGSFLWVYDQRNGTLLSKTSIPSWPRPVSDVAPTVVGTDVFAPYGDGISKYAGDTGRLTWSANTHQHRIWSPAVDGRYAYAYEMEQLSGVDVATGTEIWTVNNPESRSWDSFIGWPVLLSDTQAFVRDGSTIAAFDIIRRSFLWSLKTDVVGAAAYGDGTLYVLAPTGNATGTVLQALAPGDGSVKWTSAPLAGDCRQLIVTRNLAFVSSEEQTVAIDLATHKVVWTYPVGGDLSISANGILYILTPASGTLAAINLH